MSCCAVENVELEFYFVQVEPGRERQLDEALARQQTSSPIWRYKCLGKYDMLCVGEAGAIEKACLEEYCVDFEQVRCFAWREKEKDKALRTMGAAEASFNWTGLCFVKIAPAFLCGGKQPPVVLEDAIVRNVRRELRKKGLEAVILGGFGWHEMLVVLWHDSLAELAKAAVMIPSYAIDDRGSRPVAKTFTVFGLNFDFLRPSADKRRKDRTWSKLDEEDSQDLDLEVVVTCAGLPTLAMQELLRDSSSEGTRVVFGREDLAFEPGLSRGLGAVLRQIVEMRRGENAGIPPDAIYSTSTVVGLRGVAAASIASDQPSRTPEKFAEEAIKSLLDAGVGFIAESEGEGTANSESVIDMRRLRKQLHVLLRASLRNTLTRDAYADMVFALAAYKRLFLSGGHERLSQVSTKNFLDCVSLGYQERSWGTMNSLWNVGNPAPLFYRGGNQRILWAAESIPSSLLEASGGWNGFLVIGLARDYLRSHLGVLSLPHRVMFRPEEWWGLLHEIGHEFVSLKGKELFGPEGWRAQIREIYELSDEDYRGRESEELHYANVAWEVLSDVFDLRFGFADDWELYVQTVMPYLLRFSVLEDLVGSTREGHALKFGSAMRPKLEFYLTRMAATCCYHNNWSARDEVDMDAVIDPLVPLFEKHLTESALDERAARELGEQAKSILESENLAACCERLRLWRLMFSEPGERLVKALFGNAAAERPNCEDFEGLRDGQVLADVKNPSDMIRHLLKLRCQLVSTELPARTRIAAILSLWNSYAQRLPTRLEKLAGSYVE